MHYYTEVFHSDWLRSCTFSITLRATSSSHPIPPSWKAGLGYLTAAWPISSCNFLGRTPIPGKEGFGMALAVILGYLSRLSHWDACHIFIGIPVLVILGCLYLMLYCTISGMYWDARCFKHGTEGCNSIVLVNLNGSITKQESISALVTSETNTMASEKVSLCCLNEF